MKVSHRTTRQLVLLPCAICALILLPAALVAYLLALALTDSVLLLVLLVVIACVASVAIGLLITRLVARALRPLLSSVRARDPAPTGLGALVNEFALIRERVATDQEALHRRNSEMQTLITISRDLNRAASPEEMSEAALEQISNLLAYERGFIALADNHTEAFRILASQGYAPEEKENLEISADVHDSAPHSVNLPLSALSGAIGVLHLEKLPSDRDTWRLLNLLANLLATTVEKHRLLEATKREVRAQKLLNKAGRVLTSTLDKQRVLTLIMREVIQALNAEAGSVLLVDDEQGDLVFAAAASPQADRLIGTRIARGQGIVGWTVDHRESVLTHDTSTDPRFYAQIDQQTGLRTHSVLCVPLLTKDKVIGAIEVMNSRNGRFRQYDLQLLESLAPQAAIAIENAFLFESVKAQMLEIERAQEQLLQAEKLSAIGRLVAGVAHELNNPLTAIVGYSQLLMETSPEAPIQQDLERINREAQRSARIVQNLLAFARQQKLEKHPIKLGGVLNKTIDLLSYQLEVDNIQLVREIGPQPMVVMGDTYQLQQVFLNLITNAHQAMHKAHGQGTLTIQATPTDQTTVQVQFIDDGPGISNEIISSIFDPFFTTKDVGEGTGLGLSICLGIVQEHGGRIWPESEEGHGATFTVELPLCENQIVNEQAIPKEFTVESAPMARHTILAVDDEVAISRLLKRILEAQGHNVTAVNSGLEALEMLNRQKFDLVICDLKMPGMNGRELYAYLKERKPELARRVIFSTGDVVSDESWTFLQEVGNRFINKPFKPEQVLAEIQRFLVG